MNGLDNPAFELRSTAIRAPWIQAEGAGKVDEIQAALAKLARGQ